MFGLWSDTKSELDSMVPYIPDIPLVIAKSNKSGVFFRSAGQ